MLFLFANRRFHHSNVNNRTDEYGGTYQKRCHFTIELTQKLVATVGTDRLGIRLAPYGTFNSVSLDTTLTVVT